NLLIKDSTGITIHDLSVVGANAQAGLSDQAWRPAFAFQHGFSIRDSSRVTLDRVGASDVFGDFVYIRGGSQIVVRDSRFARNGRQGIAVADGHDVTIEDNVLSDVRQASFDLEPISPEWVVDGITIRGNTVGPYRLTFLSSKTGGTVRNVLIEGNTVDGTLRTIVSAERYAIADNRWSNWIFRDNRASRIWRGSGSPLSFTRIDGLVIEGNVQPMSGQPFVHLSDCPGALVASNVIDGTGP
ncbi:MAG TPA: right-handed parallel beta-helix repeat-containing protein, partial [Actinomycetota bacterium]